MSYIYPDPLAAAGSRLSSLGSLLPLRPKSLLVRHSLLLTYVPDRLYLGSYTQPPTANTLFPEPPVSPRKRGQLSTSSSASRKAPCYFSVDDILLYNAFHHDFGPLHIGHLYRFAIQFHDILGAKENKDRPIVFWSAADARSEFAFR